MYGILTLFSYTLIGVIDTMILLLPAVKLRLICLYGFFGITLALVFTGMAFASPLSPILFMVTLSEWSLLWFILCILIYGLLARKLRKMIEKGDWS